MSDGASSSSSPSAPVEGEPRRFGLAEEQLFLLLAIVIGIFAGLCVVCFRIAIEWGRVALLGSAAEPDPWRTVLTPTLVGLLVGFFVHYAMPRLRGSGVNQTKAAVYIYDGYIPFGTVWGKFSTSALSIGSGQSLGPEDPSLQIGAGLASAIGRGLKLSRERLRLVAPIGAAAGLSAAFNSPISAVIFVIEEVIGRWTAGMLGAVILAAISSVMVARTYLGAEPLFRVPEVQLSHPGELLAFAALGLFGGLAATAFLKLIIRLRPLLARVQGPLRAAQPAGAGLLIGIIGLWWPQVMGAGYETIDDAIHGQIGWQLLAWLAILKIVATSLSFISGAPGGLFAPTLFIGAMVGGAVGGAARLLFPGVVGSVSLYVLVGMGTLFAGNLRAPMTSVFMLLEITGNHTLIVPVMLSNTVAYLVSRRFQRTPIFDVLSRQDGLELPSMEELREHAVLRVEDALRARDVPVVEPATQVAAALAEAEEAQATCVLVRSGSGQWVGVTRAELAKQAADGGGEVSVGTVARGYWPVLHTDVALDHALHLLQDRPMLPVVHRADMGQLVGVLAVDDVLAAYRRSEGP